MASATETPPIRRWTLEGNAYLVTGGTKGIGKAIVEELLLHGASTIVYCSRSFTADDAATQQLYRQTYPQATLIHVVCDVATKEGRQTLYDSMITTHTLKELHGLINNVGVNVRKDMTQQTSEEYYNIMRANIDSAYFLCQVFLPMLEYGVSCRRTLDTHYYGSVVNVSSAAGIQSSGTGAAYGMSKAALNQMTRTLACEWAMKFIRVNSVAPWMTMTPMLLNASVTTSSSPLPTTTTPAKRPAGDTNDETMIRSTTKMSVVEKAKIWTPMQRLAQPYEIAGPVIFLLLPASYYVTGQILAVDGGLTSQGFAGPTTDPTLI
jgi:Tropinone reductase 1